MSNASTRPLAGLPRVVDVTWRVDVALRASACAEVMRPSVILRLRLSDGSEKIFECGMEAFHRLREAMATALNELEWVERDVEAVNEIGARARARWERGGAGGDERSATSGEAVETTRGRATWSCIARRRRSIRGNPRRPGVGRTWGAFRRSGTRRF